MLPRLFDYGHLFLSIVCRDVLTEIAQNAFEHGEMMRDATNTTISGECVSIASHKADVGDLCHLQGGTFIVERKEKKTQP